VPDQELLFSLLRFVALVIPAIAVIIQVLDGMDGTNQGIIRFLEVGLLLLFTGGLVIFGQLWNTIDQPGVQIGTAFILGSMVFVSIGLLWKSLGAEVTLSVGSIGELRKFANRVMGVIIAFVIPYLLYGVVYYFSASNVGVVFEIGPIFGDEFITPELYFGALLILIGIRVNFYLLNTGYLTNYSLGEKISESFQATLLMAPGILVFILPAFILSHGVVFASEYVYTISNSHVIFLFVHLWAVFCIFVFYGTSFWGEKEDGDRLVE